MDEKFRLHILNVGKHLSNMNINRKIIIILSFTLIFLVVVTIILLSQKTTHTPNTTIAPTPVSGLEDVESGILRPTESMKPGELDVMAVSPADRTANITTTVPIEITFSRNLKENEVEFLISPDIKFTQTIDKNKLIITPANDYATSSLYTYRITIKNDPQKIRIYTFSTAGEGAIKRVDTAPSEDQIKAYDNTLRVQYPDIYLYNHTPYQTNSFAITGQFSDATNADKFTVYLKGTNKNQSRADFILWLQTLDLTDAQIQSLDIEYK